MVGGRKGSCKSAGRVGAKMKPAGMHDELPELAGAGTTLSSVRSSPRGVTPLWDAESALRFGVQFIDPPGGWNVVQNGPYKYVRAKPPALHGSEWRRC
jgi:hypothetical protein